MFVTKTRRRTKSDRTENDSGVPGYIREILVFNNENLYEKANDNYRWQ